MLCCVVACSAALCCVVRCRVVLCAVLRRRGVVCFVDGTRIFLLFRNTHLFLLNNVVVLNYCSLFVDTDESVKYFNPNSSHFELS